jgi:hypothetical protein
MLRLLHFKPTVIGEGGELTRVVNTRGNAYAYRNALRYRNKPRKAYNHQHEMEQAKFRD